MDFDRWFASQKPFKEDEGQPLQSQIRKVRRLKDWAVADREAFESKDEYGRFSDRGCVCFTGCAPCSWCTHPGNPLNQNEDDNAWVILETDTFEDYDEDYKITNT